MTPEETKDPILFIRTIEALERYCYKTYDSDMSSIFDATNPTLPVVTLPVRPDPADLVQTDLYKERIKRFDSKQEKLTKELKALWAVIWGQCTPSMITKLMDIPTIETWKKDAEILLLLNAIRKVCMMYSSKTSPFIVMYKHFAFFYTYRQGEKDDIHRYFELFKLMVRSIKEFGGTFGDQSVFIKEQMKITGAIEYDATDQEYEAAWDLLTDDQKVTYQKSAKDKFLGIAFLMGGRPSTYADLIIDLQNDYNNGIDQFPNTLTEAYNVMANYTPKTTVNKETQGSVYSLGMSFFQDKVPVPGTNGLLFPHITCLKCNRNGHYANYCPPASFSDTANDFDEYSSDEESLHFAFFQHQFTQIVDDEDRYSGLQPSWVLLNMQSTMTFSIIGAWFTTSIELKNLL